MRNFGKRLFLTGKLLKRFAGQHIRMLLVQIAVFSFLTCYNIVMVPLILSAVFEALEKQEAGALYRVCGWGALLVVIAFALCYWNNVYLDLNSFRIQLTSAQKLCRSLFMLSYDELNRKYEEGDIQARIDDYAGSVAGIFPLLVSILANAASMAVLLYIGGRVSVVLAGITAVTVLASLAATRYESGKRAHYEEQCREAEAGAGAMLFQMIENQAVFQMYGAGENGKHIWQERREAAWQARWQQEKASLTSGAGMETFTSIMRGFLGGFLFRYYDRGMADSAKVASSFSIFDELKTVADNFSFPVSTVSECMVSVERMDELLKAGEIKAAGNQDNAGSCKTAGVEKPGREGEEPFLSVSHVSYSAGERQILKDMNLTVKRGEKVAIIGKNGCGKSTLLKLIGGLNHSEEGTISLMGADPQAASNEELRGMITYIPSESHLYEGSVRENVMMNLDAEDEAAFQGALAAADLTEVGEGNNGQNVLELSGGQAQRVNIARGLIHKVPLLLADEPDAGLPPIQGKMVMENLLKESGTAIVVTHHHAFLSMFDRVVEI